ncbi:MAG: hypothetical protein PVI71_17465 [Desulfobacterales bacterium]|jgi:hypothetical protein
MYKHLTMIGFVCFLMLGAFAAYAEKETEIYIPIGQSPGLSGEYTVMGKIDQVNLQNQTLKMSDASGSYTVKLTESTSIYLDRSKVKRTNTYGTIADCKVGDLVEVKFEDNSRNKPVEWIKVQKSQ